MTFAAEWCTHDVVVVLRCALASLFVAVNEWQYKDILDDIDNLAWEELSEEWCAHMSERSEKTLLCEKGELVTAKRRPVQHRQDLNNTMQRSKLVMGGADAGAGGMSFSSGSGGASGMGASSSPSVAFAMVQSAGSSGAGSGSMCLAKSSSWAWSAAASATAFLKWASPWARMRRHPVVPKKKNTKMERGDV